jgi:FkbM family methyltransferase
METLKTIQASFKSGNITKPEYIDRMHEVHRTIFQYADFLRGTDIERLEIADGRVLATIRGSGIQLVCDPEDKRIAPVEIMNFGNYETPDYSMVRRLVPEGGTVLDVGANIGYYTLSLCRQVRDVSVHSFEPIPKTFALLQEHVRINGATNATIHNFGFSEREETKTFYYYPEGSGNASSANLSEGTSVRTITCQVKRLDDFVQANGLRVDFIKCDVEGAELFVFRGAIATLKRDRPVLFTEMLRKWAAKFNYHPNEIIALMKDLGYGCYCEHQGKLKPFTSMDENTAETNFFFLHPEQHAAKLAELVSQ